jgi:DNA modification methylase
MEKIECAYDELVPLINLTAHPDNTNNHPEEQINLLADIIAYQGQRSPIVVSNRSGFITKGHGRFMAIKKLDWMKAAVDFQDYENEAQELADMEADNRIAELAERDEVKFQNVVLKKLPFDFNLRLLGSIDLKPLDIQIEKLPPQCDENEVPSLPLEPKTVKGDIYQLGEHRLMCGDSTMIDDVEKLMNGHKADMLFTDPPYNQSKSGGGFNDLRPNWSEHKKDSLNDFEPENIFPIIEILKIETGYFFCNKFLISKYLKWAEEYGLWDLLIMGKNNPIPTKGNKFLSDIEYIVFFKKQGSYFDDKLDYDYYRKVRMISVRPREFDHPTEKQIVIIEPFLMVSTPSGANVLDLFGGSGSTLIACEKTNRKCFIMEVDQRYCSVILDRWCKYTGKEAYLLNENGTKTEWSKIKGVGQ